MPYRVSATDGLHLSVLLRLAEEYDVRPLPVDSLTFEVTNISYWFFVALTSKKAIINPPYIMGYCRVRHK